MKSVKIVLLCLSWVLTVVSAGGYQCCGLFQMDNQGSVLIETSRPLTPGLYEAVRFRSCTSDQFAVQLWECQTSACTLSWELTLTPHVSDVYTYNLNTPVRVTPQLRLGLFLPDQANKSLPIPFGVDSSLAFLSESIDTFSAFNQLRAGAVLNLNSETWSRSFAKSFLFCRNKDCRDEANELAPVNPTSNSPYQPPKDQCCQGNSMCNYNSTTVIVDRNQELIKRLTNQMTLLERDILNFSINSFPPARCPPNFFPGEYGLGSCYILVLESFTMTEAALACRDYSESTIVRVDSFQESKYLANVTTQRMPVNEPKKFWMAALYNEVSDWSWYDSNSWQKTPIGYNQWQGGVKPVPVNQDGICSIFDVDSNADVGIWREARCADKNYFICEVPKECD